MFRRILAVAAVLVAGVSGPSPSPSAAESPGPVSVPVGPFIRYVDVSVATAWVTAGANRSGVDDLAISNPAYPRSWLAAMTRMQKPIVDSLETQGLYGTRVIVDQQVTVNGLLWDHTWVDGQPTPRDVHGYGAYPGWIPDRQLTDRTPPTSPTRARIAGGVDAPGYTGAGGVTAWAYDTAEQAVARGDAGKVVEFSFNTTLPVAAAPREADWVEVHNNHDEALYVNRRDVSLSTTAATGAAVVARARRFLGLAYLWAGTSGFGYDCSGFTHEVYASFGIEIPRDADAQAAAAGNPAYTGGLQKGSAVGSWVATSADLDPGDLVFFATDSGYIHHVGIYSGLVDGHPMMINSPHTGSSIEEVPIDSATWGKEFVGGGRFLTG
jgi:hypothetical protein